jgi:hypothetical protein
MKIYTFYTPSHKEIYDKYFVESFNNHLSNDFILDTELGIQKTKNGDFSDPELGSSMDDKLILLKRAITENDGNWFIYADCDIQFFDNIKNDINNYINLGMKENIDMFCQEDCNSICAGFLLIRSSKKMNDFIDLISKERHKFNNDQLAMNQYANYIRYSFLPRNMYYTVGNYNGGRVWNAGDTVYLPNKILLHHANFTIGVKNKIIMMDQVKKINDMK